MLSGLHRFGHGIIVEYILHSLGKTKENTNTSIRSKLIRAARTGRERINTAAEDTEVSKVRLLARTKLVGRSSTVAVNGDIVQAKVVLESVGPEFGGKTGATQESTEGITNSTVGALAGTILMRGVGSSRLDGVASLLKQGNNIMALPKVAALVEAHILVGDIGREAMLSQPTIEEVDRGAFVAEGFTVEGTTMMVNDKAIARFAIEAF
jgi:hypothetical protein